jgi:hypothetical protein
VQLRTVRMQTHWVQAQSCHGAQRNATQQRVHTRAVIRLVLCCVAHTYGSHRYSDFGLSDLFANGTGLINERKLVLLRSVMIPITSVSIVLMIMVLPMVVVQSCTGVPGKYYCVSLSTAAQTRSTTFGSGLTGPDQGFWYLLDDGTGMLTAHKYAQSVYTTHVTDSLVRYRFLCLRRWLVG